MAFPSTFSASMTTGGARVFIGTSLGSTATTPLLEANHKRPSAVWHPAGCNPPENSSVESPSPLPREKHLTEVNFPSAHWFSSRLLKRIMPAWEVTQK